MSADLSWLEAELEGLKAAGLYNTIRTIESPMDARVTINGQQMLNFCANNYLGLANHSRMREAAKQAIDRYGVGPGAVRTIAGTMSLHIQLEQRLAAFKGAEDCITLQSGFTANLATIPALVGKGDVIFSDSLNHASIIDGCRLSRAKIVAYEHNNMADLDAKLQEASGAKIKMIVTDGVFSMDGTIAQLDKICDLADKYDAVVMSDECHSTGFMGKTGRGVHEYRGAMGRVDIITGTFGKALGGASGGFTSGRKEIIELLRQRSRPYLFSNTLAPSITGASITVLDMLSETTELRDKLEENTIYFRRKMTEAGFDIKPGDHPIVPIMLYDAVLSQKMAARLLEKGIYVIGFYFPVVPKGQARIRVQISAVHQKEHLDKAIAAFMDVARELKII